MNPTPMTICCSCVILSAFALSGCRPLKKPGASSVPDNLKADRPIVLKEGQAIVFMPEGKPGMMMSAGVVDGKLTVTQVGTQGKTFNVTWSAPHAWTTATEDAQPDQTTTLIDKDGDGMPDIRVVKTKEGLSRFRLDDPKWIEITK